MPKLSSLTPYLLAAAVVAGLAGVAWYQHTAIESLETQLTEQKDQTQKALDAVASVKSQYQEAQESTLSLSLQVGEINNNLLLTKSRLKALEDRKGAVIAKPALVEKKINAGSDVVLDEMSCVMGFCKDRK